jgi:hypothetical protein
MEIFHILGNKLLKKKISLALVASKGLAGFKGF